MTRARSPRVFGQSLQTPGGVPDGERQRFQVGARLLDQPGPLPRWLQAIDVAHYIGLRSASGARRWARGHGIQPIWRGRGWLYDRGDVDARLEAMKGHGRNVGRRVA